MDEILVERTICILAQEDYFTEFFVLEGDKSKFDGKHILSQNKIADELNDILYDDEKTKVYNSFPHSEYIPNKTAVIVVKG